MEEQIVCGNCGTVTIDGQCPECEENT